MKTCPWHISVVIPARNEEQLLHRCLRSIRQARASLPREITSDVVVAVDSSTDATWEIAVSELEDRSAVVRTDTGSVGAARAEATEIALQRCTRPLRYCWLANTDADCVVPASWLNDQLLLAESGIEAVAGIVDVDTFEEHLPIVRDRFRSTYLIREDGTHGHVHGANIGLRADIYEQAGGWSDLLTGEDHDLWNRLSEIGARKTSIAQLTVLTSGRRAGRAPLGFAEALAAHNERLA